MAGIGNGKSQSDRSMITRSIAEWERNIYLTTCSLEMISRGKRAYLW